MRPVALVMCGFLACSLFSNLALGKDGPIEVLWVTLQGAVNEDYAYTLKEPMIDAIICPAAKWGTPLTTLECRRYTRLYYPRTYKVMVDKYEFIVLKDMDFSFFTSAQIEWIGKAVEEAGLGGLIEVWVMDRCPDWAYLTFWDAFPDDVAAVLAADEGYDVCGSFEIVINEDPTLPPVLTRYKDFLTHSFWYLYASYMIPRQGARIYAWAKTEKMPEFAASRTGIFPFVLGWQYGRGYAWCEGSTNSLSWACEYGPDAYFSMLMYSTGRPLPDDVLMFHRLKERFYEYADKKGYIISMVEFVEKFGANTNPLMVKVIVMDDRWKGARRLYIAQDYDGCWSLFDQLLADIDSFTQDALMLRDKALFWVYVSEWCTIAATFLLSGFLLWSLMVGRRLYKMVDQTRLRPPGSETGAELSEHSRKENPNLSWHRIGSCSRLAIH